MGDKVTFRIQYLGPLKLELGGTFNNWGSLNTIYMNKINEDTWEYTTNKNAFKSGTLYFFGDARKWISVYDFANTNFDYNQTGAPKYIYSDK